jgi:hypothetical protein
VQARHVSDKITTHVGGIIGPAGIHRVVLPGPLLEHRPWLEALQRKLHMQRDFPPASRVLWRGGPAAGAPDLAHVELRAD